MVDEKKVIAPISPSRVHLSEYKQVNRTVFAPVGTTPEDLKVPSFWKHVARDLSPCDEMVVFCEDMSWRAKLCVASVGPVSARVCIISLVDMSGIEAVSDDEDGLMVEWAGPYHKHRVVKKVRGESANIILSGFGTKDEAETALREYRKTHTVGV